MQINPSGALSLHKPLQNLNLSSRPAATPTPARPPRQPDAAVSLVPAGMRRLNSPTFSDFTVPRPSAPGGPSMSDPMFTGVIVEPSAPPTPTGSSVPQPMTLDGLVNAWGTNDPHYDLDGDGVVGVPDLLQMIDSLRKFNTDSQPVDSITDQSGLMQPLIESGDPTVPAEKPSDDVPVVPAEESAVPPEAAVIAPEDDPALTPAPETTEPDVASPSTDPALDFRAYIDSMASGQSRKPAGVNGAGARAILAPDAIDSRAAARSLGGLKPMADSLFNHLSGAGFAEQPPTNIRELVDALNLAPRQTDFLLKQLAMKYPAGLGVNMVG